MSSKVYKLPIFDYFLSIIKYLSNYGSTVLIAHMVQNLWVFLFFTKFIEILTSFYKIYWRHGKNDSKDKFWYGTVY